MVLGLRGKNKKGGSVQVDYLIHVHEINPWPQQLLKYAKCVLLQWENGDESSGYFASDVGDETIVFNESFKLRVNLRREASKKSTSGDRFQKSCLEFFIYEHRKEKTSKGQLLGSAVVNLADYGIIKETVSVKTPVNLKKSSKSTTQSVLHINIESFDLQKDSSSLGKDGSGSVSEFMEEENEEEAEIASFTDDDDDVSSLSSQTLSSSALESRASPSQSEKIGPRSGKTIMTSTGKRIPLSGEAPTSSAVMPDVESSKPPSGSSSPLPMGGSSYVLENAYQPTKSSTNVTRVGANSNHPTFEETDNKTWTERKHSQGNVDISNQNVAGKVDKQPNVRTELALDIRKHSSKDEVDFKSVQPSHNHVTYRSDTVKLNRKTHGQSRAIANNKLKHVMSVQYPSDLSKGNGPLGNSYPEEKIKGTDGTGDGTYDSISQTTDEQKYDGLPKHKVEKVSKVKKLKEEEPFNIPDKSANGIANMTSESKQVRNSEKNVESESNFEPNVEFMSTIEVLMEELREAAAMEAGLYSVVAEHGSSINKVHAPARRLSRFFSYACKTNPSLKRANAAKTVVSGLVLVSKACGNDVARLTFWLSNSIVLRALVSQDISRTNTELSKMAERFLRKIQKSHQDNYRDDLVESSVDWEDPKSFIIALEKVEAWIFYRIVESVWWQSMTPHMQSAAAKGSSSKKSHGRKFGLGDQDLGKFSIDLWRKAFKDACERLCPSRAEGHECGCLSVLLRLVMEQLVDRLDVAMFNAILRESAEDMPTDPVSDPISDPKVLPIPAGKSSFGAGAQLKNAIGNWSRLLTDIFGIDETDAAENSELDDNKRHRKPSRLFHLLNALSDLMMLPFEMLADKAIRKEVCPTFGASMIKRVLNNFVPDEFSPNQIPDSVYEALDSEESEEDVEGSLTEFPCKASPTIYCPPSTASVLAAIEELGSQTLAKTGSSVLKKSYTSDDELDELESPLTSITIDNSRISPTSALPSWMVTGKGGRKSIRYQLLREVWRGVN